MFVSYILFLPFLDAANIAKKYVYAHIGIFYVCSTIQNPQNENYFCRTVGGPIRSRYMLQEAHVLLQEVTHLLFSSAI